MADDEGTEEKKHDASAKKLRDLRKKGQVPTAQEAVQSANSAVLVAMCLLLAVFIASQMSTLFREEFFEIRGEDFSKVIRDRIIEILVLTFNLSIPFLAAAAIVGVFLTLGISGFVFSAESLIPDFNKLNPVKGAENIVGIKGLKTFLMHIVRLIFSTSVASFVAWYLYGNVLAAATCEFSCGIQSVAKVVAYVLAAFLVIYFVTVPLDYIISITEFMRQQKMTDTEVKEERKETQGSPEVKQTIDELRRETATKTIGARYASFILHNNKGRSIGVFYDPQGSELPIVVAKFNSREKMDHAARKYNIHVAQDSGAVETLRKVPIGGYLSTDDHIDAILPYI